MKKERISIIVPVYNVKNYLDECIKTIVEQSYQNIEIILVNDGSTDGSDKKCNDWALKDKRIKVYHKKNGGVSSARNLGITKMHGEYVTFIDSDDYIKKDYIEKMLIQAKEYNADLVIGNAVIVTEKNNKPFNSNSKFMELNNVDTLKMMLTGKHFQTTPWAKLYNSSIVKEISFNEQMEIAEDLDFLIKYLELSKKTILTPYHDYYYRIRQNSSVRTNNKKMETEIKYDKKLIEKYKSTTIEEYAIKHFVNINLNYAMNQNLTKEEIKIIKRNIGKYKKNYSIFSTASKKEKIKYIICMNFYSMYRCIGRKFFHKQ